MLLSITRRHAASKSDTSAHLSVSFFAAAAPLAAAVAALVRRPSALHVEQGPLWLAHLFRAGLLLKGDVRQTTQRAAPPGQV
jgi:hypothetical protein